MTGVQTCALPIYNCFEDRGVNRLKAEITKQKELIKEMATAFEATYKAILAKSKEDEEEARRMIISAIESLARLTAKG